MSRDWDALEVNFAEHTDKFSNGYRPVYEQITRDLSDHSRILEIGVWKGGSLHLWREVFPAGTIVGVDSFRDMHVGELNLPEGAHFEICDQAMDWLPDRVKQYAARYDMIIDDASHHGEKSARTFELLWPLVSYGGWYVLEDFGVGVPGNHPFYGYYGGTSQLVLAQSFLERMSRYDWRPDGNKSDISEIIARPSIIAIRKRVPELDSVS